MQVPVFLTRHVFVKVVPDGTLLLSGMVTSATNEAPLVQSKVFVGMGVSGVEVELASTPSVSVAVGASVGVAVAIRVSVRVGVTVSAGAFAPQAEIMNITKRKIVSSVFFMGNSFLF
jgi:hypothetical protein